MGPLATAISLLLFFLSLQSPKRRLLSPIQLFFALWSVILLLSCFNPFGLIPPFDLAYALIITMLIFFFLGHLIATYLPARPKIKKPRRPLLTEKQKLSIFYTLCILFIIFNLIDCIIILKYALEGTPVWQIRNWSLEPLGSDNPILNRRSLLESAFRAIILEPFWSIVPPIAAHLFFNSKTKRQKAYLLSLSLTALATTSLAGAGSRLSLVWFFACFALAYFSKTPTKKPKKKPLLLSLLVSLGLVALITGVRSGFGNFLKQTYTYFALAPTLLTLWLPALAAQPHTYGLLTTFGFHSYFFRGLKAVGLGSLVPNAYNQSYAAILGAEKFLNVGYRNANAFVTPIYYFLTDGGIFFVMLASLIFGFIVSRAYQNLSRSPLTTKKFTFYSLIIYGVFVSFMRIQTAIPSYILSFIYAALLTPEELPDET